MDLNDIQWGSRWRPFSELRSDVRSGETEEGKGGTLAAGTLRYILSIEGRLLRELKDDRLDSVFELTSLSISRLFSLVVFEGGAGEELFFLVAALSLIEDEEVSSVFCEERGDTRVATGGGTAMPSMSGSSVFGCALVVELSRLSTAFEASFLDGEACREVGNQLLRENIFNAPDPLLWDLTKAVPDLSGDALALSDSSISLAETKRAADMRFFVFELARRNSSILAF